MFQCNSKLDHARLWSENFGHFNFVVSSGNASIVGLATPLLQDRFCSDGEHKQLQESVSRFISAFRPDQDRRTRILLSHIPLWSSGRDRGDCNQRHRARKSDFRISMHRGSNYQNLLDMDLSLLMMGKIKPHLVLSGDGLEVFALLLCFFFSFV